MATTGVGFRWLDILEKEFDKACVELDTSLTELETEEPEAVFGARQKIATLGSCFAQLTHKALTIFQNSAKLEAELVDMRAELVQARAATAGGMQDSGDTAGNTLDSARARSEAAQLARENAALRETVLALHSELFGARLATKYLDKELAGRIQQLQLLGRNVQAELRDSLWAQVEAEILLQRHKTLVRVCRGLSPRGPRPPPAPLAAARPRTVRVRRSPHLGLGISVTGGREHGVPILISELEAGGPAALTQQLYVGDAILAINELDLTQACHKEAVQALQSVKGDCQLCVQFIATDDDDRLSEDNYRFPLYPEDGEVFGGEPDGSGATPTAPRTPDYNNRPESEVGSVSGSGSERGAARGAGGRGAYPDYNAINNNLAILDMDDHSIKIETSLEVPPAPRAAAPPSPPPRPPRSPPPPPSPRSPRSPLSTPVHARRPASKKKRKPDWRTKGAYRQVDATSSDDPLVEERPRVSVTEIPNAPLSLPLPAPELVLPPRPIDKIKPIDKLALRRESKGFRIGTARRVLDHPLTNGDVAKSKFPNSDLEKSNFPNSDLEKSKFPKSDLEKSKFPNGDFEKSKFPKSDFEKSKFPNGEIEKSIFPNGDLEKSKFPACLLTGEGDPDFGTPV